MKHVQTVLGLVPVDQLGVTLMHEHLLIGWPGWVFDPIVRFERVRVTNQLVERMQELKALGVSTVVDPCPIELGRNPEVAAEVADRAEINIICATGLYTNRLGIPVYFRQRTVDEIAEIFVKEVTEGIGSSGIRAGLIKCATGLNEITRHEEKCLRAAGRAHKATGAPVLTHTEAATMGLEQLDILASEGVNVQHVVIGHCCGTSNLAYHVSLLDRGAFIGFDRFGLESIFPDRLRIASLVGLLAIGYADRIVLSHDAVGCFLGRSVFRTPESQQGMTKWNYTHLLKEVIPTLHKVGISEAQVQMMLVENPRRYFGGSN
ncbi:MAG: phosphotriesterase [Nitrospinae bacterium]|nr:phosphotriesterase [Nitrospinota bacterium]